MAHIHTRAAEGLRRRAEAVVSAWLDDTRGLEGAAGSAGLLESVGVEVVEAVAVAIERDQWDPGAFTTALRRIALLRLCHAEPWGPLVACLRPLAHRLRRAVHAELLELDAPPATLLDAAERAADAVERLWVQLVLALDDQDLALHLRRGQYLASFGRPLGHDLRNHAYAVQMQLRLLAEDHVAADREHRERLLRRARDAVKGISTVSSEHIERWLAEPAAASRPAPFADLLADLVQQLRAAHTDAEILVGGAVPCRRIPDGDRVWLALYEIASFAMSRASSGSPRLVIRAHDTLDAVLVELRDQGPTLDPIELSTLFDPPRPEGAVAPPPSGLWAARRVLADLGGDVVAGDAPRGGLLFTLTVPRLTAAAARAV